MDATFLLQLLINGLVIGVVYALIATGLSLIFGVLEIVNFAHGEFYMLGAMLAYFLAMQMALPYWLVVAAVLGVALAAGYVLYLVLLSSLRGASFERSMLLTLGLSMVLQNGAIYLFTTSPRMMRTEYSFRSIVLDDLRLSLQRLIARLAARGFDAPRLAFEGDKAMFGAYSDEPRDKFESVLGTLGQSWRIFGNTYKTVPTETITHDRVECVLAILKRANGRPARSMRFGVEAIVVKIANEQMQRFGAPASDLEARFDLRHCAAAAWLRGRFTLAEMREDAYTDAAIPDLRSRIELVPDATHRTFDGASLEVTFTDGSVESVVLPAFRGTPGNPLTDAALSEIFRVSAERLMPPAQADAVLDAAWGLKDAPDLRRLMSLLVLPAGGPADADR